MKRDELEVGKAYYWDTTSHWACPRWGSEPGGIRAVVVDLGFWRMTVSGTWDRNPPRPEQLTDTDRKTAGAGVLVDVVDRTRRGRAGRNVAQLGHLRGLYDETFALVAYNIAGRQAAEAEKQAERDRIKDLCRQVCDLGFTGAYVDHDAIAIPVIHIPRLIAAHLDRSTPPS